MNTTIDVKKIAKQQREAQAAFGKVYKALDSLGITPAAKEAILATLDTEWKLKKQAILQAGGEEPKAASDNLTPIAGLEEFVNNF